MPKTTSNTASLYGTFGPLIYARCRRALSDEALAAKATEEVFLTVRRQIQHAEPRAAVEAIAATCERVCRSMKATPPWSPVGEALRPAAS